MKKNQNKQTFASRAKAIMRKYPRASFDKIEKNALEMEMDALIAEQEATKQAMGMQQPMGQQQEMPMFGNGEFLDDPYKRLGYQPVIPPFANELANAILQMQSNNVITPDFGVNIYATDLSKNKQTPNNPTVKSATSPTEMVSNIPWNTNPTLPPQPVIPTNQSSIFPAGYPKAQPSFLRRNYTGWNGGINYPNIPMQENVPNAGSNNVQNPATPAIATPPSRISTPPIVQGMGNVPIKNSSRISENMLPMQNMQGIIPGGIIDEKTGQKYDFSNYKTGATIGRGNFMYEGKPSTVSVIPNPNTPDPLKSLEVDKINKIGQDAVSKANTLANTPKETNPFLPSYISAGATIGGNLLQMLMDRRPKPLNLNRYAPENIDLTEQRLAAQRESDVARAVGRTTARNLGMNAGSTMANIMSAESGVSKNLSDALLQSRLAEQTANVDAANRAGMFNAELGSKETMLNRQMLDDWRERQRGYVAGAIQAVPDAMKDINQIKYQYEQLKQMGVSEENALKWLNQKYPNYQGDWEKMITNFKKG